MPFYQHSRRLYSRLLQKDFEYATYQQHASPLYALEARHTLFHLKRLLIDPNNPVPLNTFKKFLKKRWNAIKSTDLQYCYEANSPANHLCIEVAQALGSFYNTPYLLFLMPSLAAVSSENYITSSYEEALELNHLLLSDDYTRLIHILDVLAFAKEDGTLKHNSLLNGSTLALSLSEQHRLLARHPGVEQYYLALQDKHNFVLHGETAGAYLQRLIHGLREGGVHRNGDELIAHDESNIAIAAFDGFLQGLDADKRGLLLAASKFDRWQSIVPQGLSIGQCWQRLARPKESDGDSSLYCVEMVANHLEEILAANPGLYQLLPFEEENSIGLAYFEARALEGEAAMHASLSLTDSCHYYGAEGDLPLALKLCRTLAHDTGFQLRVDEVVYIATLYNTTHQRQDACSQDLNVQCTRILTHVGQHYLAAQINRIMQRLTPAVRANVAALLRPPSESQGLAFFQASRDKRPREIQVSVEESEPRTKRTSHSLSTSFA